MPESGRVSCFLLENTSVRLANAGPASREWFMGTYSIQPPLVQRTLLLLVCLIGTFLGGTARLSANYVLCSSSEHTHCTTFVSASAEKWLGPIGFAIGIFEDSFARPL